MTDPEKLDCQTIFALLSEYLDAELPAATCEEISRHIAGCAPCVEFVESLKKSIALCRETSFRERPAPLPEEARAHLREAWGRLIAARQADSGHSSAPSSPTL